MHHFPTALILITTVLLAGCFERSPDLESPKTYNSEQITFQYPGNWKVSMDSGIGHLTLETPGDAIVIVQTHPPEPQLELEKLAKAFSEEFLKETPIGEMKVDGVLGKASTMSPGMKVRFPIEGHWMKIRYTHEGAEVSGSPL